MNEMYNMGLDLHSIGTIVLLVVVFMNLFLLLSAKELPKYKRSMSIVFVPFTLVIFGLVLFTGIIMMAAKHLDFTLENLVMIFLSIVYIALEVKRIKSLKYLNAKKERAFDAYKAYSRRILQIEFIMILAISIWMWLI